MSATISTAPEQVEGVAEGEDEGLLLHDVADRDIGAVRGVNAIDDAVVHEILRELLEPGAGRLFEQRNRLRQDVGMILLALGRSVCSAAMPMAPPRFRIMLNSADADPAFSASIPAVATAESGANTRA